MKAADVVYFILEILEEPYTCREFGADYTIVLLKDILSVKLYWYQIISSHWLGKI